MSNTRKRKFEETLEKFTPSIESIETLPDLIKVITEWKRSRIDQENEIYRKLYNTLPHLKRFNNMIGMKDFKKEIVKQIIYFAQGLNNGEMMNMIITGNQGVGKSTVCEILAKIYGKLEIVSHGHYRIATRTDFIANYMGQTANKTRAFLESCMGGIVFIDEAYMIGTESEVEDYAKECVNLLNTFLSENQRNIICILAGYKDEIQNKFLDLNRGLDRRFPWRFHIDDYGPLELADIFLQKLRVDKWRRSFQKESIYPFFIENHSFFQNNGGDCEKLLSLCKIIHSNRVFIDRRDLKTLSLYDFETGGKQFIDSIEIVEESESESEPEFNLIGEGLKLLNNVLGEPPKKEEENDEYKNLMYI